MHTKLTEEKTFKKIDTGRPKTGQSKMTHSNPQPVFTQSSPHPHPVLTHPHQSSPSPHPILTQSSPHPHLSGLTEAEKDASWAKKSKSAAKFGLSRGFG